MKKNKLAVLTSCLVLSGTFCTQAQNKTPQEIRIPDTYKLTNKSIYRNGWIDFNKNGKKDVYEDPTVPIDARVEDLLSQMNVEEKNYSDIPVWRRYTLTIEEAARYYHIGEGKLRTLIDTHPNEDFYVMNGNRALIKREKFERYLDQATAV